MIELTFPFVVEHSGGMYRSVEKISSLIPCIPYGMHPGNSREHFFYRAILAPPNVVSLRESEDSSVIKNLSETVRFKIFLS